MTPGTAILNYIFYSIKISNQSIASILVICAGIAITTYFEALAATTVTKTTSLAGVFFALSGVTVSSVYGIWVGTFAKKFGCSSMQLLLNQAPYSALLLLIGAPFFDTFPDSFADIPSTTWGYIALSGSFAILINVSQFFIIHGTNALTSTIVGHVKSCSIVALGWIVGGAMNKMSVLGVLVAISGIFLYSAIQQGILVALPKKQKSRWSVGALLVLGLVLSMFLFDFGAKNSIQEVADSDPILVVVSPGISTVEPSVDVANVEVEGSDFKDVCSMMDMAPNFYCHKNKVTDLRLSVTRQQRIEVYEDLMDRAREPTRQLKIFAKPSSLVRLEIVLIELNPLFSSRFQSSIKNIANVYGGSNTALTVIYSPIHLKEVEFLKTGGWQNVRLIHIDGNYGIPEYNNMLTSKWFWDLFPTEFVLITHTDSIIFRPVDEEMYAYDLIGAPWPHRAVPGDRRQVGNGGHTLRKVSAMKLALETNTYDSGLPEDVWISLHSNNDSLPTEEVANLFAAEMYSGPDIFPSAAHQIYGYDVFYQAGPWFTYFEAEFIDA